MTRKIRPQTPLADAATNPAVIRRRPEKKGARSRAADVEIALVVADERHSDTTPIVAPDDHPSETIRETLAEQRLPSIPGELAPPLPRHLTIDTPSGPMTKTSVHQTESKIHHPLGKTRNGVPQRSGK